MSDHPLETENRRLREALKPFAARYEVVEQFIEERARDGGSPIMPLDGLRLADFRRARAALAAEPASGEDAVDERVLCVSCGKPAVGKCECAPASGEAGHHDTGRAGGNTPLGASGEAFEALKPFMTAANDPSRKRAASEGLFEMGSAPSPPPTQGEEIGPNDPRRTPPEHRFDVEATGADSEYVSAPHASGEAAIGWTKATRKVWYGDPAPPPPPTQGEEEPIESLLRKWAKVLDIPSGRFVNEDLERAADEIAALRQRSAPPPTQGEEIARELAVAVGVPDLEDRIRTALRQRADEATRAENEACLGRVQYHMATAHGEVLAVLRLIAAAIRARIAKGVYHE